MAAIGPTGMDLISFISVNEMGGEDPTTHSFSSDFYFLFIFNPAVHVLDS